MRITQSKKHSGYLSVRHDTSSVILTLRPDVNHVFLTTSVTSPAYLGCTKLLWQLIGCSDQEILITMADIYLPVFIDRPTYYSDFPCCSFQKDVAQSSSSSYTS